MHESASARLIPEPNVTAEASLNEIVTWTLGVTALVTIVLAVLYLLS